VFRACGAGRARKYVGKDERAAGDYGGTDEVRLGEAKCKDAVATGELDQEAAGSGGD